MVYLWKTHVVWIEVSLWPRHLCFFVCVGIQEEPYHVCKRDLMGRGTCASDTVRLGEVCSQSKHLCSCTCSGVRPQGSIREDGEWGQ